MNRQRKTAPRNAVWPAILLLILAMLAVYGVVGRFDFLNWDDQQQVIENPLVNPPSWHGLAQAWRQPYWNLYIPLSYNWFAMEALLATGPDPAVGMSPAVFHLCNLLIHVGCVLLVFTILRRLLTSVLVPKGTVPFSSDENRDSPRLASGGGVSINVAACFGAILFGLHPLQVESVAWISEARGLLCGLFSLVDIWQYVEYAQAGAAGGNGSFYKSPRFALATLAFAAALLSKPAAVAVPLMVVVLDIGLLRRPWQKVLPALCPWLTIAAAQILLTKELQPDALLPNVPAIWTRPLVAGDALAFYLWKLVVPWQLGPDYGRTPQWSLAQWWIYAVWLPSALLVVVLARLRDRRVWLVAFALFVAWLLPVLGFVCFTYQRFSTVADRYAYLAMLGPALALSWLLARARKRRALGGGAVLCGLLAGLSFQQTLHWRDTGDLFAHAQAVNPSSVAAAYHLGLLQAREGRHAEAIALYRRAMAEHPEFVELPIALADSLLAMGKTTEALNAVHDAAGRFPDSTVIATWAVTQYNLGNQLRQQSATLDQAVAHYEAALEANPKFAEAQANLGIALLEQGKIVAAIEHERAALDINPQLIPAIVHLGRALEAAGFKEPAAEQYRKALELLPPDSEPAQQLQYLLQECTKK
jgi:tetratricopeptide (TPR) repeat protein